MVKSNSIMRSNLNWAEIDQVLEELALEGSFIQKITQLSYQELLITFYREGHKKTVLFSLKAQQSGLWASQISAKNFTKAPRLMECLKKYLSDSCVTAVEHWHQERIIIFTVENHQAKYYLIGRFWGPKSQLYLCNEKLIIIDVAFRRPSSNEVTGKMIQFPEPNQNMASYLVRDYAPFSSLNQFLMAIYDEQFKTDQASHQTALFVQKEALLNNDLARLAKNIDHNRDYEALLTKAQLLVTVPNRKHTYCPQIEVFDYTTNRTVTIALKPSLSVEANRNAFNELYQKQKKSYHYLLNQYDFKKQELEALKTAYHADRQLVDAQLQKEHQISQKKGALASRIKHFIIVDNSIYAIGRNAEENENILRNYAKPHDWWFHVRGYTGGYIVLKKSAKKILEPQELLNAAALAHYYSKAKNEPSVDVEYTQIKYLRKNKKSPKGEVVVTQSRTIGYKSEKERLKRLFIALK